MKKQDKNTQEGKSWDSFFRDVIRTCKENASLKKKKERERNGRRGVDLDGSHRALFVSLSFINRPFGQ